MSISGIGAWTAIGHGRAGLWDGVLRGETAVRCVSRFDASQFRAQNAAEIDDFDPLDYFDAREVRRSTDVPSLVSSPRDWRSEDARLI